MFPLISCETGTHKKEIRSPPFSDGLTGIGLGWPGVDGRLAEGNPITSGFVLGTQQSYVPQYETQDIRTLNVYNHQVLPFRKVTRISNARNPTTQLAPDAVCKQPPL